MDKSRYRPIWSVWSPKLSKYKYLQHEHTFLLVSSSQLSHPLQLSSTHSQITWLHQCTSKVFRSRDSINVLPRNPDHVTSIIPRVRLILSGSVCCPWIAKTALLILASTVSVETHLFSGPSYLWLPTSWGPSNRSFDCYDGGKTDINQLIARLFLLHSRHNSSLLVLDSAYGLGLSKENIVILICEI